MLSIPDFKRFSGVLALLAIAASAPAQQDESEPVLEVDLVLDREPEKCLSLNRINRTRVVDDQTVLFYMRGGGVYQNILPRDCPGLKRNDRFMYRPFSNRLCDTDTITVLERLGGRFDRGFTCRLGQYHPLTELEADDLLLANDEDAPGGGNAVEITPVELPDAQSEDSGDSE
jgi:hypothetical protein